MIKITGKTVYTVNAATNSVDEWICLAKITGLYLGKKEKLCILANNGRQLVLPKRFVFIDKEKALAIAKSV